MSGTNAGDQQHDMIGVGEVSSDYQRTTHPDAQWFGDAGLGLFLHWGISAVHGGIELSWGMMAGTPWTDETVGKVTPSEYFALADRFNPQGYDPDRWISAAAAAGFRYAVLTTKHHDGFALWPSKFGEFSTRTHLGGRDLVQPYVDACRGHGIKVGLYYSPPDWYWNREYMSFHYGSPAAAGKRRFPDRQDYDMHHRPARIPPKPPGWDDEFRGYVRCQIEELLERYHPFDLLWFDGGRQHQIITIPEIREYNPGIVVNPRLHGYGDFKTPEGRMPDGPVEGWWELCDIWSEAEWGHQKGSGDRLKPLDWMLDRLRQVRKWGGNYLVNVGPKPDGTMPEMFYQRMDELKGRGGFRALNQEFLRGT